MKAGSVQKQRLVSRHERAKLCLLTTSLGSDAGEMRPPPLELYLKFLQLQTYISTESEKKKF